MEETIPIRNRSTQHHGEVIQVITRAAAILRLFSSQRSQIRAIDAITEVGLRRSTVERYLSSLTAEGFLRNVEGDSSYAPGPLLIRLGEVWGGKMEILDIAQAHLIALAAATHETAALSLWGGYGAVIVRSEMDRSRITQVSIRTGSVLSLAAAQSRLFLAYMQDQKTVDMLLEEQSPSDRAEISSSLTQIAADGYAIASEVVPGIRTMAVPVIEPRNQTICATIALVGTSACIPDTMESASGRHLLAAAAGIRKDLDAHRNGGKVSSVAQRGS